MNDPRARVAFSAAVLAAFLVASDSGAALTPIFEYRFPESYGGDVPEGAVTDQSAAANHAKAYGLDDGVIPLSEEVPPGAPGGARSLDLAAVNGSIRTDATGLLARDGVIEAGGFTMDVWFKGVPDPSVVTTPKVMDNWGTEFIAVSGADTDGDGKPGEVVIRLSNTVNTWRLDVDDGLDPEGWNHVVYTFTVTDASDPASVVGDVTVILNDVVRSFGGRTMTAQTSNSNRPTSVGRHPVNNGEYYSGLVYNPSMYFGVEPLAQPVVALTEGSADGFTVTIRDGASPVVPDSIQVTLDGENVAVDVAREDDLLTVVHAPPLPLAGGVRLVAVAFRNEAGTEFSESFPFNVIGSAVTPVFVYSFPASWDGSDMGKPVEDRSPAGHHATLMSVSGEPVPLSADVPPGAPEGTRSLDFTTEPGAVLTEETRLLHRQGVLAGGGFTGEVWFKGVPEPGFTALQKILDYAGTEFIAVSGADSDNDGSPGELAVRFSTVVRRLDADDGLNVDGWNHVRATFTVTAAADLGAMTGDVEIVLNGKVTRFTNQTLNNQGDTLDRVTAIGAHPTSGGERYTGLVYNPSYHFGVVQVDEPEVTAMGSRGAGVEVAITDRGDAVVDAGSVVFSLDGAAQQAAVQKDGDVTRLTYVPAVPLAPGRHSVVLTWLTDGGTPGYAVRSLVIAGSQFVPLLEFAFPDSYDGTGDGAEVLDLTGNGYDAVATGLTPDAPVPLSEDVPAGAPQGARSLDFASAAGAVVTTRLQVLNKPVIVEAGGFTIDLWFKGGLGEGTGKVLDYAGTEYIAVSGSNSDADDNEGEVFVGLSNNRNFAVLDADDGYLPDGWNHLVWTFEVTDEFDSAAVVGNVVIDLNGIRTVVDGAVLTNQGDSLNRPLAIGRHPVSGENFTGLVYHPVIHLGVPPVTSPPPAISISRENGSLVITFTGTLQSSTDLAAFTDVPGAVSPWTVPDSPDNRLFFRARQP